MAVSVPFVRRFLLCVIVAMLLSACGDATLQSSEPNSPAHNPAAAVTTPGVSAEVPDSLAFSAPRVGGGTVDFAAYVGKPVLLWFWAPT
jgi:hypothetical protein